jgi:SAM domain (Sterile alpha motif)/Putative peptidoglycan binding domain
MGGAVDIAVWLRELGLERYERAFRDNDINVAPVTDLSEADLDKLGVASLGHRKMLLRAIQAANRTPPRAKQNSSARPQRSFVPTSGLIAFVTAAAAAIVPVSQMIQGFWSNRLKEQEIQHEIAKDFIDRTLASQGLEQQLKLMQMLHSLTYNPMPDWVNQELNHLTTKVEKLRELNANLFDTLQMADGADRNIKLCEQKEEQAKIEIQGVSIPPGEPGYERIAAARETLTQVTAQCNDLKQQQMSLTAKKTDLVKTIETLRAPETQNATLPKQQVPDQTTELSLFSPFESDIRGGSNGDDVRKLQLLLVMNGYDARPIDGVFGPGLDRIVRSYQIDHKLPETGIADLDMLKRLESSQTLLSIRFFRVRRGITLRKTCHLFFRN